LADLEGSLCILLQNGNQSLRPNLNSPDQLAPVLIGQSWKASGAAPLTFQLCPIKTFSVVSIAAYSAESQVLIGSRQVWLVTLDTNTPHIYVGRLGYWAHWQWGQSTINPSKHMHHCYLQFPIQSDFRQWMTADCSEYSTSY